MNAKPILPFDCNDWLLNNTREPKAPFRSGSTLHRLNIQNGRFYKELSSFVTHQGQELEEGSLVYTMYDNETLTRKVGVIIQHSEKSIAIGDGGLIAFNMDAAHKQFVVALPDKKAIKLADTGYPIVLATVQDLEEVIPENIAILNGLDLFKDMQIDEMTNQELKGILNEAYKQDFETNLANQAALSVVYDEAPLGEFEVVDAMAKHGVNLATNSRLEPYSNLANAIAVLRGHPKFSGRIWYDTFHQEMFTTWDCEQPRKWVDADRLRVTEIFQRQFRLVKFSDDTVEKAAIAVAQENQRDELREWLLSLQWDGQARINSWMAKAAGVPRDEYHDIVGANFLRSLVARGLTPGCKVDTMPVFEGKQGLRKSTMLSVLGGKFYSELTESLDTKDFFVTIQGVWLVEVGEMQSMRKTDVTRIKQILSSCQDRCRLPYARRAADLPRRVVFAGTTNEGQYLRDPTGARRFWPIACEKIDLDWLQSNREQLFAEAVSQVKNGATWWEIPEDAAREQTDGRRETDPWEEFIAEKFQFRNRITTSEVLDALEIPLIHQTNKEQRRVADALKALGFERKKVRMPGTIKTVWAYVRQSPVIEVNEPAF